LTEDDVSFVTDEGERERSDEEKDQIYRTMKDFFVAKVAG
jgi:hypothetical protein